MTNAFTSLLAPLTRRIADIEQRLRSKVSLRRAVVTSRVPLRVRFDGETSAAGASPSTLLPVQIGDRVVVAHQGTQMIVLGRIGELTGLAPVHPANEALWQAVGGGARWWRDGSKVTLTAAVLRTGGNLTAPGAETAVFELPDVARPSIEQRTFAYSQRNGAQQRGAFGVYIHTDGRVVLVNNDPDFNIVTNTTYYFSLPYRAAG